MSIVRPEFGPTLPELLAPRFRALPRAVRIGLAVAVALMVVALVFVVGRRAQGEPRTEVVVREPLAYNLVYAPAALERVRPRGRETLRLQTPAGRAAPQSFAVTPFTLPAYRGDATGVMTVMAGNLIRDMRARFPGFVWRGDGRVNYNRQPGYEILFQTKVGGRTTYGRRTLLVPGGDVPPREGLDIMMLAARSDAIPKVDAVAASNGPLKTAIRSLRFGTERP
jgi:hypothetical protein